MTHINPTTSDAQGEPKKGWLHHMPGLTDAYGKYPKALADALECSREAELAGHTPKKVRDCRFNQLGCPGCPYRETKLNTTTNPGASS